MAEDNRLQQIEASRELNEHEFRRNNGDPVLKAETVMRMTGSAEAGENAIDSATIFFVEDR